MDIVEFLMVRRTWRNLCLRTNIVPKDKIEIYKKTRLAMVESNALGKTEHLLREAIQLIAPEWWDGETKFCLNRNVQCEKHKDRGNTGHSYVLFLGDFTGGALLFEDGTRPGGEVQVAQDLRLHPALERAARGHQVHHRPLQVQALQSKDQYH